MITKRPSKLAASNPKAADRPAIEPQATSTKPDTREASPGPSQAPRRQANAPANQADKVSDANLEPRSESNAAIGLNLDYI